MATDILVPQLGNEVTEAEVTMVAVDEDFRPTPIASRTGGEG